MSNSFPVTRVRSEWDAKRISRRIHVDRRMRQNDQNILWARRSHGDHRRLRSVTGQRPQTNHRTVVHRRRYALFHGAQEIFQPENGSILEDIVWIKNTTNIRIFIYKISNNFRPFITVQCYPLFQLTQFLFTTTTSIQSRYTLIGNMGFYHFHSSTTQSVAAFKVCMLCVHSICIT